MSKQKSPRVNKTKEELAKELEKRQRIEKQRKLAHDVFPAVTKLKSVYDAQTAFNAVAGFIKYGLAQKEAELKVSDLSIELSKEKDSDIKKAVVKILSIIEKENAKDAGELVELMGSQLPQFLAGKAMKGKMSQITAKEFIAD